MKKKNCLFRNIRYILLGLVFAVSITSCTITPEIENIDSPESKLTTLDTPVIKSVAVNNSSTDPSITVTWDPIDNAQYYVFSYQKANSYLTHEEMKNYTINVNESAIPNQYTIDKNFFDDNLDLRVVFQVKAGTITEQTKRRVESEPSNKAEAVIINDFEINPVIEDSKLSFMAHLQKAESVLNDDGTSLVSVVIKYYNGDYSDSSKQLPSEDVDISNIVLASAEQRTFTAVLFVDDEEIKREAVTVTNSIQNTPEHLEELTAISGGLDGIVLNWKYPEINTGVDGTIQFTIERKSGNLDWTTLKDSNGNDIFIDGVNDGGELSYKDESAEPNIDYKYRVRTVYTVIVNDKPVLYRESSSGIKETSAYRHDTIPSSFIVELPAAKTTDDTTKDAEYKVNLTWDYIHVLPEGTKVVITRYDFDNTASKGGEVDVYEGSDKGYTDIIKLTAEEDKKLHQYGYKLKFINNGTSLETETLAKTADGNEGVVRTEPTMTQIDWVSEWTVSSEYADKIEIKWSANDPGETVGGLTKANTHIHILRADDNGEYQEIPATLDNKINIADSTYVFDKPSTGHEVKAGKRYSYRIRVSYDDSSSEYNGEYPLEGNKEGKTLDAVSNLVASLNTSSTDISISWDNVEGASGYKIRLVAQGTTEEIIIDSDDISFNITTDTDSRIKKGTIYDITVGAVDSYGGINYSSATVQGSILGPITPEVSNDKGQYIAVTWKYMPNVERYRVQVYNSGDATEPIASATYPISSLIEYDENTKTFEYDFWYNNAGISAQSGVEYPLSVDYYFTVEPVVSGVDVDSPEKVSGSWIKPPTNITATKAAYRDMIVVTWEDNGSSGYNVYRRELGGTNWSLLSYSENTEYQDFDADGEFEYTVTSVASSIEGPKQDSFKDSSNYGYNLMAPKQFTGNDISSGSNEQFKLRFNTVLGATSYKLVINNKEFNIDLNDSSNTTADITNLTTSGNTVSFNIPRQSAMDSVLITASLYAINKNAAIADNNASVAATSRFKLKEIYDYEVVNILNSALRVVYTEADIQFGGDWYDGETIVFVPVAKVHTYSNAEGTVTMKTKEYQASNPPPGSATFNEYVYNNFTVNGNLQNNEKDGGGAGFLGTDPLDTINGTLTIKLPYDFGTRTVTYNNYEVGNNYGTVSVSYKNGSETVTSSVNLSDINVYVLR